MSRHVRTPAPAARPARPVTALLLVLFMGPSGLYYIGLMPSTGVGLALPALCSFLLWHWRSSAMAPHFRSALNQAAMILVGVLVHLMLAAVSGPTDLGRGLGSLVLLALFLLGAIGLAELLSNTSSSQIQRGTLTSLHLMGVAAFFGALGWLQPNLASFGKSVFPFTEPSHLALSAAPLLLFACARTRSLRTRLLYLAAALLATAVLQNLTMAVICVLIAGICLPLRYLIPLALLLLPLLLNLDLSYYTERLDFSDDSQNLSALVFLQGWLLIDESWDTAGLLGRGFQQLGIFGTDVYTSELIQLMNNDEPLNLLDGGFVLSKLLSEFGILGALLAVWYLWTALRAAIWLRRLAQAGNQATAVVTLAASSIVAYSVELMVRGAGYFTPSGLLLAASLWIWLQRPTPAKPPRQSIPRTATSTKP